ncbi:DUF2726 domain-containing protein [Piscinibacter terrae]|nr:DUF2726 domain-containing protein [Albitalea terrae]
MNPLVIALILILAMLLVWWGVRNRAAHSHEGHGAEGMDTVAAWPPQATRVLTTQERQTYDLLRNALPAHMILAQVPLQRFIKVPTRNSYAEWLRRVGHLSADFVICDRHAQVMAVVELRNDDTLSGRARRRQDRLLKVLAAAQIPVHQWQASALPSVEAAREAIAPAAEVSEQPGGVGRSAPGRPSATRPRTQVQDTVPETANEASGVREPPPSTWFDDLDTGPAPLDTDLPPKVGGRSDRASR